MLARMASKTWQTDPEAAMFVDRDGERFRYILDYMRDGKVHLQGEMDWTSMQLLTTLGTCAVVFAMVYLILVQAS
jgi:hypothetical protein